MIWFLMRNDMIPRYAEAPPLAALPAQVHWV